MLYFLLQCNHFNSSISDTEIPWVQRPIDCLLRNFKKKAAISLICYLCVFLGVCVCDCFCFRKYPVLIIRAHNQLVLTHLQKQLRIINLSTVT